MSPAKERKNRFQVSREVQEEFVNGIAETMLSLAEKAGKWQQGWTSDTPVGMPFCPVTGRGIQRCKYGASAAGQYCQRLCR